MLNEALVVDLRHVRVLQWSKKNHGGKTKDISSAAHHKEAALTRQFSMHTLTSQLSAVLSPSRKLSQQIAGITLAINSHRLHMVQSHTLLNPNILVFQKIQLLNSNAAQYSQSCCPVTRASQRLRHCNAANSVPSSETLSSASR